MVPPFEKGGTGGILLLPYNRDLKNLSRSLRNNMTAAERLLWSRLRSRQIKGFLFYRQKIIGEYIVDFYCPKAALIIEVDGGQHYSIQGREKDKKRDEYLTRSGLNVLRFSDNEVLTNINSVMEMVWNFIGDEISPVPSLPKRGT
jgi:very-short-patch-repair endonuclease